MKNKSDPDLKSRIKALGLKKYEFARLMSVDPRTVHDWYTCPPSAYAKFFLAACDRWPDLIPAFIELAGSASDYKRPDGLGEFLERKEDERQEGKENV